MGRRKDEITSAMNERDLLHIVELPLPSGRLSIRSQMTNVRYFAEPHARRRLPESVRR
jgi:hypothetical protein